MGISADNFGRLPVYRGAIYGGFTLRSEVIGDGSHKFLLVIAIISELNGVYILYKHHKDSTMNRCLKCSKETKNPRFCSRNCAAIYNNTSVIKRKLKNKCKTCDTLIKACNSYCKACFQKERLWKDMTLQEAMDRYKFLHKCASFALVRYRAKVVMKDVPNICVSCGYSKHTEVCHIKAISDYPMTTLISEINKKENLIKLCPNCHWESEHGDLDINKLKEVPPERLELSLPV